MEPTTPKKDYVLPASILIAALLISGSLIYNIGQKSPTPAGGDQNGTPTAQQPADWSFVAGDPAIGPKDAKITVTEFADFQCPFCGIVFGRDLGGAQYDPIRGTATKISNEYAKTGKIRFVYHIMAFLGQESVDAANAALCAREIGGDEAFFKMHDALFAKQGGENKGDFSKANLKTIAADAGFNTPAMVSCIDSGKYNAQVSASDAQAKAVGVEGTPAFAINNVVNPRAAEYTTLKAAIDGLLNQ